MSAPWPTHFSPEVVSGAFGSRLAGYTIALEAWRRGLRVRFKDSSLRKYEISDGQRSVHFDKSRPTLTTKDAIRIEQDKYLTSSYLRAAGVPVPASCVIDSTSADAENETLRQAAAVGYPVVLKPLRGSMGKGVYTNLKSPEELTRSFHLMTQVSNDRGKIVLEQHFEGDDYRVLVVGDRVVAACLRVPANVVGDGKKTIRELIEAKNAERLHNPYLCKKLITVDEEVKQYLHSARYAIDDVPAEGVEIRLRGKANASQGGDSIDKTSDIPVAVRETAAEAVQAIPGLAIAGVDILFDADRSSGKDSFRVVELNSRPEIEINMYPWEGAGQDAPQHIIDVFFPSSRRSEDLSLTVFGLNLDQLLAPLRGASGDEVVVKKKPQHNFPTRMRYDCSQASRLSANEQHAIYLAARKAGISGHCVIRDGQSYVVACGTADQVRKFVSRVEKSLGIDTDSASAWARVVTQGFHFES